MFQERDEVLQQEASPSNGELAALVGSSFASLCEVKQAGDSTYYRLSDAKVCTWTWHARTHPPPDAPYLVNALSAVWATLRAFCRRTSDSV